MFLFRQDCFCRARSVVISVGRLFSQPSFSLDGERKIGKAHFAWEHKRRTILQILKFTKLPSTVSQLLSFLKRYSLSAIKYILLVFATFYSKKSKIIQIKEEWSVVMRITSSRLISTHLLASRTNSCNARRSTTYNQAFYQFSEKKHF